MQLEEKVEYQLASKIQSIFPEENSVPAEFQLKAPIHQTEYLINGELCHWDGPTQESFSSIYLKTSAGLAPKLIGSFPLLTEKEAQDALDAASSAYRENMGRLNI